MKFKHLFFAAALFSIAPLFCACNDDDNEIEVPRDPEEDPSSQPDTTPEATSPTEATGLYVINAGNLSNNVNGTLSFISILYTQSVLYRPVCGKEAIGSSYL